MLHPFASLALDLTPVAGDDALMGTAEAVHIYTDGSFDPTFERLASWAFVVLLKIHGEWYLNGCAYAPQHSDNLR